MQPPASSNRSDHTGLPVALVLGAAVWSGGEPSPTLLRRARHAARLHASGQVSHIIGCGGIGRHPPSEAAVIRRICLDEGVPERALLVEERSANTLENLAFALPLLSAIGTSQVAIVTDRYHLPRARLIARRLGLTCASLPPPPPAPRSARSLKARLREIPAYLWYLLRAPAPPR